MNRRVRRWKGGGGCDGEDVFNGCFVVGNPISRFAASSSDASSLLISSSVMVRDDEGGEGVRVLPRMMCRTVSP